MLIAERQSRLQKLLAERGLADVDSLAAELNVSLSTVRRDLEQLEKRGIVSRTHGGAIYVGERDLPTRLYGFDQRLAHLSDVKQCIGLAAASLIKPGETLLLGSGSTIFYLAKQLPGKSVQIVTNSLPIADLFVDDEHTELILTGGLLYPRYAVLLGPIAEKSLEAVHASTLFLSAAGVHDGWLYNQNSLLVESDRRMIRQAQRVVLLVDSSKFGTTALARMVELKDIHIVITDSGLSDESRKQIQSAGCQVILVENAIRPN